MRENIFYVVIHFFKFYITKNMSVFLRKKLFSYYLLNLKF